jgi:hypothetical protein
MAHMCVAANAAILQAKTMASANDPYFIIDMSA